VLDAYVPSASVLDAHIAHAGDCGVLNGGSNRRVFGKQGGQLGAHGFVLGQRFTELETQNIPVDGIGWGLLDFVNRFRRGSGAAFDLRPDPIPKGAGGKVGGHLSSGGSGGLEQLDCLIEQL